MLVFIANVRLTTSIKLMDSPRILLTLFKEYLSIYKPKFAIGKEWRGKKQEKRRRRKEKSVSTENYAESLQVLCRRYSSFFSTFQPRLRDMLL